MQRMPGAGRADRAPFGGTATTGLLRLAERDVYVTLRRTVRTLPSGRGRVRHAWIARTPARYPTGAGRTGTPSPESPYVPRRFRSGRPGLGADDALVGAGEHGVEGGGELPVPVANQESELSGVVAELHEQVAGLLGDPVPGGVGSDEAEQSSTRADLRCLGGGPRGGDRSDRAPPRSTRRGPAYVAGRSGREGAQLRPAGPVGSAWI